MSQIIQRFQYVRIMNNTVKPQFPSIRKNSIVTKNKFWIQRSGEWSRNDNDSNLKQMRLRQWQKEL